MALTCKQISQAWGIAVTKVTQAREPTFRKMARVMLMFPAETMAELSEVMQAERESILRGASWPGPASERELYLRECMVDNGRIDREEIHPPKKAQRHEGT